MSEQFHNKDYGDYFKALEQQMNKSSKGTAPKTEEKPIQKSARPKKGVYKVVRLRKSVLAVAAAVAIIICGSVVIGSLRKGDSEPQIKVEQAETAKKDAPKKEKISYSFENNTDVNLNGNDAKSIIIIDKSTNSVIASKRPHDKEYPASTTKIMTLLVAAENIKDYSDTFTMTYAVTDPLFVEEASVAGFLNNEKVTMTDLLYGTILPSGADAAMGLALKISGSEEEFVKLMNKKVKELGLKNTHFTNVTGLHNEENYSSAYDMAVMLDAALQNELCREVLSTYQHTTAATPQNPEGILLSSTLFSNMYGTEPETATILGGKTGFVNESGYCIASYGKGNESGKEYIIVSMGNSGRWPAFYGQIDLYRQYAK